MEAIPESAFIHWLAGRGIGIASSYPGSRELIPVDRDLHALWTYPQGQERLAALAEALLDSVEPWGDVFLWPRDGLWPTRGADDDAGVGVRKKFIRCLDGVDGWQGALRCTHADRSSAVCLMFIHMLSAQLPLDDLYLVTDAGHELIYVDCERALHLWCRSDTRLEAVIEQMESRGFGLPRDLPVIFKLGNWMAQRYRR